MHKGHTPHDEHELGGILSMNKQELKQRCFEAIDQNQEAIIALAEDIYAHPEMGYHEVRSTKKMEEAFLNLGLKVNSGVAYTGCDARIGDRTGPVVSIMSELDCLNCPEHPDSVENGNVHSCGHHAQLANLYGCAVGLVKSGIMPELAGAVKLIAIPAEECVDLGYRDDLIAKGEIAFYGGKQEYLRRGGMDDVDMVLQAHLINMNSMTEPAKCCCLNTDCDGFVTKTATFLGCASHAGFAPANGINALNMAQLALSGIHALRETFRDEDKVRVSAIITHGGDMVNIIPSRVELQIMVRAFDLDAMLNVSKKVDRALKAGALAMGGQVEIHSKIGYLPLRSSRALTKIYAENVKNCLGCDDNAFIDPYETAGSTDLGDLSQMYPCMHIWTGGISGALHTKEFRVTDPEKAYIFPAKMLTATVVDLLYGEAEQAKAVCASFHPVFTRKNYLDFMQKHARVDFFDGSAL